MSDTKVLNKIELLCRVHLQTCQSFLSKALEGLVTCYFFLLLVPVTIKSFETNGRQQSQLAIVTKKRDFYKLRDSFARRNISTKLRFLKNLIDYFVCECNKITNINKIFAPGRHGSFQRNIADVVSR